MQVPFGPFAKAVHERFFTMSRQELYTTQVTDLFDKYLTAFPPGTNPVFRVRTEHDCQCCKQFIRRIGGLVNIVENQVVTLWDNLRVPEPYKTVADTLGQIVRNAPVINVFRTVERKNGAMFNFDLKTQEKHEHFYGDVADKHFAPDPGKYLAQTTSRFQVLKRGLDELRLGDFRDVLDLIKANGLYTGEQNRPAIQGFHVLLQNYQGAVRKDLFAWTNLNDPFATFRNTAIGTLFVDLAEGKDLENAVKAYEVKVAPTNYKRTTAVITQTMIEKAMEQLKTLGLYGAIERRFARLTDVSVNDVLFVDNESRSRMKDGLTLLLEKDVAKPSVNVDKAVPITSEEFITKVLPEAKTIGAFVENRHQGNFLSLTCSDDPAKLFKWDNPFAWSYDGDVADSVRQRVKAAGGNVNAKLRVSLAWFNLDDLDLHADTPDGQHIYFNNKRGILDVDMNAGVGSTRSAVENLAFNNLVDGTYKVWVHQFHRRETIDVGFSLEVEFNGVIRTFSYGKVVSGNAGTILLHVKKGELVKIEPGMDLTEGTSSQDKWGVKTETIIPVVAVMKSPNHWGGRQVGAEHLIFALKGCKNPGEVRGIYNEFLRPELETHRKVFEVLGSRSKVKPADDQISGIGFTKARSDTVTVVVNSKRLYTISF